MREDSIHSIRSLDPAPNPNLPPTVTTDSKEATTRRFTYYQSSSPQGLYFPKLASRVKSILHLLKEAPLMPVSTSSQASLETMIKWLT